MPFSVFRIVFTIAILLLIVFPIIVYLKEKKIFDLPKNFWYPHEIKISTTGKEAKVVESRFAGSHFWNKISVEDKNLIMYTPEKIEGSIHIEFEKKKEK